MTVFPVRRVVPPTSRVLPPAAAPVRARPTAQPPAEVQAPGAVEPFRPGVLDRARRFRAERGARRLEAAGARALTRLDRLGPAWHIVDWPRIDPAQLHWSDADADERAGFLAIGPGGVFAVTVADHGRARVLIAGDVVQINGKRPAYVTEARRDARRAGRAMSAAVGLTVPVTPVLTFVGSGVISVHGLPKDCLVATDRELDRLLVAGGSRITPVTANKLTAVASHPATWMNAAHRAGGDYRWYEGGRTATDKRPTRR